MVGIGLNVKGATAYTWTGTTNSSWATTTNWSPNGNPGSASGDAVSIGVTAFSGSQPTLSVTPANALVSLTFGNATAGSLTITGVNLTVNGLVTLICGATNGSTITGTGTLTLGGDVSVTDAATGASGTTISCNVALGAANRTFTVPNNGSTAYDLTVIGIISSTTNGFIKAGAGTMMVSGTNTFTGATTINAGVLNIQNAQGTGTTAGGVSVASGAALELQGGISVGAEALTLNSSGISSGGALRSISGANTYGGLISVGGGVAIGVDLNNLTLTGGIANGSGSSLTKNGSGTLIINSSDGTTGAHTINGGIVQVGTLGGLTADAWVIKEGTTLDLNGQDALVSAAGNKTITLTGGSILTGSGTAIIAYDATVINVIASATPSSISGNFNLNTFTPTFNIASGATLNISAVISNGSLYKTGAGILTLSGTNTYSGTTTISAGTLIVGAAAPSGSAGAFGNATSAVIMGDAATTTNNSSPTLLTGGAFTIARAITIADQSTSGTYSIGGNTDNNSTFSGAITINQPLKVTQIATSNTNTLSITGGITTGNSGTKNLTFDNAGLVTVSSTAITKGTGDMAVTKQNNGALTLSTSNSYTGGITLSAGTLNINNAGSGGTSSAIGTGAFTIIGGTLDNTSGSDITLSTNNAQAWNGDFIFTGSKSLNMGTGAVSLSASRIITVNGGTLTAGGIISGSGNNLSKAGSGTLSFGGNALTLYGLTINAGILTSTSGTLSLAGDLTNNSTFTPNGGTVTFNNTSFDQNINGTTTTQAFNNLTVSKSTKNLIIGGSITKVTVGSTLTMTSGNIDCGSSNTLELGTTTSSVGTLTYTAGNILGNFKRWISATGTGILFPVGTAADNRKALVTFTNLTSGSLTGKFIASDPGSTGLPLSENSYGIAHQFTEGYWSLIAADALVSTNYAIELTGTNFISLTEDANVRIIKRPSGGGSWSLNGSHVAGVAPTAKRSGLSGFSEFGHGRAENCLTAVSTPTPSTQTVCNNTSISSISVTPTGGTALTYQWYSNSTNNNSTGTSLGSGSNGEQTATYTPPATTTSGTTYYYCVVSQPGCNSINSTTASVTVNVSVTYGSVASGDETICYNGTPSSMSASGAAGSGSFSYQWYSKSGVGSSCPSGTSTSGWSSLGTSNGSNTATYTPAAGITSSITYACFVTPGGSPTCGTATWTTGCRKVTVNSNFTSGAIATTNQTICYNGDPSVISSSTAASGGDGTITYQWQKSTTSSSSGFADISGTNSESYDPPASLTVTTWYRRQAHDGTCNTGFTTSTGVWQVTVRDNFTSGTIPSTGETICYNGNPGQIGSTSPASGGDESITYRWQSSTDSGFTSPTDISSNTETYDPPTGLNVSTWYRRQAKEGTCNTTFTSSSGVWKVTVHNNFTAGEISATSETICYNGDPSEIGSTTPASGGDGTITYRWQSSDDHAFTSPTNISSNTATYNPPTGLTVSTWYRRQAKDGTCNTTFTTSTGVWKVTVYNNFTAGEIATTSETICYNGDPLQIGNLTPASGGDESITYHWQSSTDADFTSPTTISSSNSATYNPPANLTTTTWYRRQAHDGTCNTGWETSTGAWKVTVYNNFTPGAIETTGETICYNGNPSQIGSSTSASGGNSSITYKWESSTDGFATAGSLISGATSATYDPPTGLIATTSYRRYAKDGTCNTTFEVSTGTWVVTVRNNFTPGAIETTGETICYNGNPAPIGSSTPASGGDESITYKWESSTDGFATAGSLISGATSATYDPPTGLTATTSYRRYAKDGTCNTTFEVSTCTCVVTVRNNFKSGEIETSGETICFGGNPASIGSVTLASGADESITYTWQKSTTGSLTGYSDIPSSNSATYDPPVNLTESTWYRRQAKDGTCNTTPTSSTGVWKVTVYAEFTAGAIETTGESICYSGNPVEIGSSTAASGGNESITYQWQSSLTSNFASPTNINSSNSSTYDPPTGLIATTWYRRQAKDGACNTNWNTSTGTWKVTVVDPDAPTGPATQTYCSAEGKTITDLTATLVSGINIKWYSAPTGGTQYQNSDVLVSRSYFASQTNGDGCESTTRKEVAVTINANPNLTGLSTTPTNVCQEDPSVVTVSATSLPNGTYTVNYTLTGDNAQGATDIPMTVSGGTNSGTFSTPDLTTAGTTTVTINSLSLNSCPTTATAGNTHAITITATGTWLGTTSTSWNTSTNWCGGVPGSSTNVVVPSAPTNQPHVDITNAVSNNLTVNSGAVLTIDAAKALTVNGTLTNSAGNNGLILKSDGTGTSSLVHTTASVPATVERYFSGAAEAWHFLSSPVASQSISGDWIPSGTYGNGTGYDLYVWDEVTRCWIYKLNTTTTVNWNTVHSQGNFVPGRGYLYSVQATNPTKSFGGNLNNGSYDYPITLTNDTNRLKGFNLVGNPYPSSVDWQATSGWGRSNLVGGNSSCNMWVWSPSAGNYGLCSSSGGSGTNGVTRYIAPMQGFFVQAVSSGNLGFSNSVRVHNEASDWKSVQINSDTISVIVQSESDQTADEVRILFGYPANETGAAKLFSPISTAPSLYLSAGKENFTVRYLTDTIANPHVPLQFKAGINGYYTLSFNFETAAYKNVMLEDRKTKQIQDLKIETSYRFNASTTDAASRFVIHFVPVKPQEKEGLPAKIYTDGTHILVDLTKLTGDSRVLVYNVIGQKLYEQQLAGETQHTLNFNPGSQLLIIQLQNPMGQLVRKIVYNNTSQ